MNTTLTRNETQQKVYRKAVLFEVHAPGARSVHLAGDFNGWASDAIEMIPGRDGNWLVTLRLTPGFYEYKYIIDGVWTCADDADRTCNGQVECVNNDHGSCNRVIRIRKESEEHG
ncbi:MAG: glycogen-binding domain-containing protein [Spirochaetia bacterium]|nr:glycogen-binding domain-containing protein [Spirochaetia bacterium]